MTEKPNVYEENPYVILGILPLHYRNFHFYISPKLLIFALEIKSENRLHLSIEQALCLRFALSLPLHLRCDKMHQRGASQRSERCQATKLPTLKGHEPVPAIDKAIVRL